MGQAFADTHCFGSSAYNIGARLSQNENANVFVISDGLRFLLRFAVLFVLTGRRINIVSEKLKMIP